MTIPIEKIKELGIPVQMSKGLVIKYCDSTADAASIILDLEDFPELKEVL